MCGIVGVFSFEGRARCLPLESIAHRGPDSRGEWSSPDGMVWLGMTRLAILDLSPSGDQPMIDAVTQNVIVFNGEIYNHPEIREELEKLGASFRGSSDTETLLAAYRHWGANMLARLKGMFAFAIYDATDGSVFLARDRFGIKPLYYYRDAGEFVFASEARPILQRKQLQPTPESIAAYLQWGSCPHELLLFPALTEFPVGAHMRVSKEGTGQPVRFWPSGNFHIPRKAPGSRPELVRRTRELLEQSVREHLLSDVPMACFLSGGIDSSAITALAARELRRELHTFSVGFGEATHDESRYARQIAAQYGTDHCEIRLSAEEVIETTKEAVLRMDLPSVDGINSYIVAKQVAKNGFKVALSGLGGDELFGGYSHFRFISRLKHLARVPPFLFALPLSMDKGEHLFSDVPREADAGVFAHWWRRLWNGASLRELDLASPRIMDDEARPVLADDFARISWSELRHYMRDVLLRDADQMSMAVSLEMRVPFLDHKLVEFVLGLPGADKERRGMVKSLLVDSVRDLLPGEIYQRRKMGFELPMAQWMRGPLRQFTLDGLTHAVERQALTEFHAMKLHRRFLDGQLSWHKVWTLVVLGWYLQKQDLSIAHDQTHAAVAGTSAVPNVSSRTGLRKPLSRFPFNGLTQRESVESRSGELTSAPLVYVIVLNFNGREHLGYCLPSLLKTVYQNFRVLLVDNASTDDSVEFVARNFPEIEVLRSARNLGWAGGNNLGIRYSLERGARYVVLANNDILVHPEWITAAVAAFQADAAVAILSGTVFGNVLPTGIEDYERACRKWNGARFWRTTEFISGMALFVDVRLFKQIGMIDEAFWAYGEETDLEIRAEAAGYARALTNVPIWHHVSGTFRRYKLRAAYLAIRNAMRLSIKHEGALRQIKTVIKIFYIGCWPWYRGDLNNIIIARLRPRSIIVNFGLDLYCLLWNLLHLPQTLRRRREDYRLVRQSTNERITDKVVAST